MPQHRPPHNQTPMECFALKLIEEDQAGQDNADDGEDCIEAEILEELSLKILRRRLNTQMGKRTKRE